jgi:hypothetical protein
MNLRWRIEGEKQGVFHTGSWMPAVAHPDNDPVLTTGQPSNEGTVCLRKPFGSFAEQFQKALLTKERVRIDWEVELPNGAEGGPIRLKRYVFERARILAIRPMRGAGPVEEVVIRVT